MHLRAMNGLPRHADATGFKAGAMFLLGLALVATGAAAQESAGGPAAPADTGVQTGRAAARPGEGRTANDLIAEIESLLKVSRRPLLEQKFLRTHRGIAGLVDELAKAHPHDPRVARYLPERWAALNYVGQRDEALAELDRVLATSHDAHLRTDALYLRSCFRLLDPIDEAGAVALAESFAREAPHDDRAAQLLDDAARNLGDARATRFGLLIALGAAGALTLATALRRPGRRPRSGGKLYARLALAGIVAVVLALGVFLLQPADGQAKLVSSVLDGLRTISGPLGRAGFFARMILDEALERLRSVATARTGLGLALAAAAALVLVTVRGRLAAPLLRRIDPVRLWTLGFVASLAALTAIDAWLIARRQAALEERIVREYPDSFGARTIRGERRQREWVGKPFALEFTDAITGALVSVKRFR
jgi:hypothetical protein